MKELFVTYDIALAMKELGFDKPCFGLYYVENKKFSKTNFSNSNIVKTNDYIIDAPLWQQCMDWLKEKHGIFVFIDMGKYYDSYEGAYPFQAWCKIYKNKELINFITVRNKLDNENFIFYSYEEAREQAILKAIELFKNQ